MTENRLRWLAAALAVSALAATGCGSSTAPDSTLAKAEAPAAPSDGASSAASETQDVLALVGSVGIPSAPNQEHVAVSLGSLDRFGAPTNPFNPSVKDAAPSTGGAGDPFGTPTAPGTGDPTAPTDPSTPTTPDPGPSVPLEADFEVAGEPAVVREGDLLPPDTGELKVIKLSATSVTLQIVTGVLPDGSDSFSLKVGRTISLRNKTTGDVIGIRLKAIRTASSAEVPSVPATTP